MRILLVASDRMEFRGMLRHLGALRPVESAVDWARAGRLGEADVLLVANGVGSRRAAAAVDAALERFPAEAVISTGFCGALDEKLAAADVVVDVNGRPDGIFPRAGNVAFGPICSVDHVVRTAAEKRQLRAQGALAVEMEAAGVAARAEARALPFYCVRAVTDLAGETLANDFNAALRADGHFDTMRILGQAFRHPGARLPELLRLRGRCTRAARSLGEFFADCRF
jgi:nucleoside phosphorylase